MKAMPTVAVYVTDMDIYAIAQQMTDHGRVSTQPMVRLTRAEASPQEVGRAVLECFDAFTEIDGLPEPDHLAHLLQFVGQKSWGRFAKRALNVSVEGRTNGLALAAVRADSRGAYLYGEFTECPRDEQAIGDVLLGLVVGASA